LFLLLRQKANQAKKDKSKQLGNSRESNRRNVCVMDERSVCK
jgi:hypothetical protein